MARILLISIVIKLYLLPGRFLMKRAKSIYLAISAILLLPMAANAVPITFTQVFSDGFDVSINGGHATASGPITIVGIVDDATSDTDGDLYRGEFALTSVTFTGAGFVDEAVTTSLGLLVWGTDTFAFQLLGQFNDGITGWNGNTSAGDFITDVNDLTTLLALPYTTSGTSTFWWDGIGGNTWTLASGDTIGGNLGGGGSAGTFSIAQGSTALPEPGTLALLSVGLAGMVLVRRRKKA